MWAKQDFSVSTTRRIMVSAKPKRKWEKTRVQTEISVFICHEEKNCIFSMVHRLSGSWTANVRHCKFVFASIYLRISEVRLVCQKICKRVCTVLTEILWTDETKIELYENDGRRKVWRKREICCDPKHAVSSVDHSACNVMVWAFLNELTADRSSGMRCEVYRPILSAPIKTNAAKLSRQCLTVKMSDSPKESIERNPRVPQSKEMGYSSMAKTVTWSHPMQNWMWKDPQTNISWRWLR